MNANQRILIVDDDPQIRRVLRATLIAEGYEVWNARQGDEALDLIRGEKFDLVLLDLNLPDMMGIDVCRTVRSGFNVPIIVLTVRTDQSDKIAALEAGATDYVTKPYDTLELLARIRANLRRRGTSAQDVFVFDDFVIDLPTRTVNRDGEKLRLSPKEYQLLRFLLENRGKTLSHRALLQTIWGPDYGEETALLQAVIAQLRRKIEPDPKHPQYVVTIPWVGYRFG